MDDLNESLSASMQSCAEANAIINRPHKALSPDMCVMCYRNLGTNNHLFGFCTTMWLRSMGANSFLYLMLLGFAQRIWDVFYLLISEILRVIRKGWLFGMVLVLLLFGGFGWKEMLKFSKIRLVKCSVVGQDFVCSLS